METLNPGFSPLWKVQGRHLAYGSTTVSLRSVSLCPEGWL